MTAIPAGSWPRLLVIMGSGETSPTMIATHREVFARLGPPPVPAVLLDTPFAFQENAADIAGRAVKYFRDSVGQEIGVARLAPSADPLASDAALAAIRNARYVFAGPGSPSYALRQWAGSAVPGLLAEKLRRGGCLCFASAAALTLGVCAVPVYEIYKVGADPHWLPGLDLLAEAGIRAAVIPHYDNAEGGTHDTRYCYLGERRLAAMEPELPDGAFVLGVDEHTACTLDLDEGTATVTGRGGVTVRRAGRSDVLTAGTVVAIADLPRLAEAVGVAAGSAVLGTPSPVSEQASTQIQASPLLKRASELEAAFEVALERGDLPAATAAVLDLEAELTAWSADTLESDEPDRVRAALRSMIVRLGQRLDVAPLVKALLDLRSAARAAGRYDEADEVRDRLVALGIEVNDSPQGTTWRLLS